MKKTFITILLLLSATALRAQENSMVFSIENLWISLGYSAVNQTIQGGLLVPHDAWPGARVLSGFTIGFGSGPEGKPFSNDGNVQLKVLSPDYFHLNLPIIIQASWLFVGFVGGIAFKSTVTRTTAYSTRGQEFNFDSDPVSSLYSDNGFTFGFGLPRVAALASWTTRKKWSLNLMVGF